MNSGTVQNSETEEQDKMVESDLPAKVGDVVGISDEELREILARDGLDQKEMQPGDEIQITVEQMKRIVERRKQERHAKDEKKPCFACERNQELVDKYGPIIEKDGYITLSVQKDPQCVITLGLTETYGFPELIVIGYDSFEAEEMVIEQFIDHCIAKGEFHKGDTFILKHNDRELTIGVKGVIKKEKLYYMKLATHKYSRNKYKAVQLIIPDLDGRLPGQDGYKSGDGSRYLLYQHCWNCLKANLEFSKCSKCHHATYCDTKCQKANWKYHKEECTTLDKYHKFLNNL